MQAMDQSHVALVFLQLRAECFETFRCDSNLSLGISIANLGKIIRIANVDDKMTIRSDGTSNITFGFEDSESEKLSEF